MSRGRRGFSLVEALAAVALAGVGVSAALKGISSMTLAQAKSTEKEHMVRLAIAKLEELTSTGETTNVGGTFDDPADQDYVWEAQSDPGGVDSLMQLTVTVKLNDVPGRSASESVIGLTYEEPFSTGSAESTGLSLPQGGGR